MTSATAAAQGADLVTTLLDNLHCLPFPRTESKLPVPAFKASVSKASSSVTALPKGYLPNLPLTQIGHIPQEASELCLCHSPYQEHLPPH